MLARNTVESFAEVQKRLNLTESFTVGLRTVEVAKIVGSVNRWQDFDANFRLKLRNRRAQERFRNIFNAMQEGKILPPVILYKVKDKYYVVDGNHRVAAAKLLGQTYIDANVTEFLPPGDSYEHILWREKSNFELKTNLSDIEFSEIGLYDKLMVQIELYRQELNRETGLPLSTRLAAQRWYSEIYKPVVEVIRRERILDHFPYKTEADLFLYVTYHKIAKTRLTKENVSYREALADFRPPTSRSVRGKLIDLLSSVLRISNGRSKCPYGLILDEDGLVRITKNCGGCTKCQGHTIDEPQVISDDDVEHYMYLGS